MSGTTYTAGPSAGSPPSSPPPAAGRINGSTGGSTTRTWPRPGTRSGERPCRPTSGPGGTVSGPRSKSRAGGGSERLTRLGFLQLRKHVPRQACVADVLRQLLHRRESIIRHLLLGHLQKPGHVLVRPSLDEEQLQDLDADELALVPPVVNHLLQGPPNRRGLELDALVAPGQARRPPLPVVRLLGHPLRRLLARLGRPPARPAQVVRDLVRGNGEQVRLQLALVVEVGERVQEADERLLDDVLGGGPVADAADRKGHQPALVQVDEPLPGGLVAPADVLDEHLLGFGGHAPAQP